MTRLEATSEPSMEDILASIRKIIAEDPPGSRPAPAALPSRAVVQPQQPEHQPSLRATERDSFFTRTAARSDVASVSASSPAFAANEPYLRSMPDKSAPAAFASKPFFSSTPASAVQEATSSRIEPSFAAAPFAPDHADAAPFSPVSELSVDAQLSDLLGDVMPDRSGAREGAEPVQPVSDSTATSSKSVDARPGFTVSRDGFVADGTERARPGDPFEFDLGPSPFQSKPAARGPAVNSMTARMSASALQRISAPSDTTARSEKFAAAAHPHAGDVSSDASSEPAVEIAPSAASEPTASEEPTPAIVEAGTTSVSFAAPSVASTIAPASTAAEPIARFIPANASVETPKQIDRDVLEVMAPQRISSGDAPMEVMRVSAEAEPATAQSAMTSETSLSILSIEGHERSIEDTVAELLRPMLKTWLAENMPRIVERALRRELSEQLLIDKKAAAE